MMFRGMRQVARESRDLAQVLAHHNEMGGVLFYAEDTHTFVQFEGYLRALLDRGHDVTYVTSADDDPVLDAGLSGVRAVHLDHQVPQLFGRLQSDLAVLTMPDLGNFHVPAPPHATTAYVFHSLNSVHTSYRQGAFDHYDVFFCTGPHHERELSALFRSAGLPIPRLESVGYYKLDRIVAAHRGYEKVYPNEKTVVIAPSWAPGNLLESCGPELIGQLASIGLRVVVRPHPQFFHSLYPEGAGIVRRLQDAFGTHPNVVFETTIDTEDSFHEADLMVSDWSGAAFEYAFGTLRPVLFVDTPQKLFNPDWASIDMPAFEASMRTQVGEVVGLSRLDTVADVTTRLLNERGIEQSLETVRSSHLFNVGASADIGAEIMAGLLADR